MRSDLAIGADEGGLQEVTGAPGVLVLPDQVRGGVVGSISRGCPDLFKIDDERRFIFKPLFTDGTDLRFETQSS